MKVNQIKGEVMLNHPELSEEDYWKSILGLYYNSLTRFPDTLSQLSRYYDTHDESELGEEAEQIILHYFRIV